VVREAMHAAFLYHAIQAGLDMGIVNAGQLAIYDEIDPELKRLVEDLIFNRSDEATERILEFAKNTELKSKKGASKTADEWRKGHFSERIAHALVAGID